MCTIDGLLLPRVVRGITLLDAADSLNPTGGANQTNPKRIPKNKNHQAVSPAGFFGVYSLNTDVCLLQRKGIIASILRGSDLVFC